MAELEGAAERERRARDVIRHGTARRRQQGGGRPSGTSDPTMAEAAALEEARADLDDAHRVIAGYAERFARAGAFDERPTATGRAMRALWMHYRAGKEWAYIARALGYGSAGSVRGTASRTLGDMDAYGWPRAK